MKCEYYGDCVYYEDGYCWYYERPVDELEDCNSFDDGEPYDEDEEED